MFVKIKMEPQSSKALGTLKDIKYIAVDDDATITTLKMQIQQYVNVPAGKQEIRTLTKSFANSRKVKELCDDRGASIMLYAFDDNQEQQFVCFLQIYNDESKFKLQELELLPSSAIARGRESTPNISLPSGTLIAVSEAESSDNESGADSDSNVEVDSSGVSDNSLSLRDKKKRKIDLKQNVDQKRLKTTPGLDKISPTLCKYLDEFPKSHSNYRKCYETNSERASSEDSNNFKSSKGSLERTKLNIEQQDTSISIDDVNNISFTDDKTTINSKEIDTCTAGTCTTHISPTTSTNTNKAPNMLLVPKSPLRGSTPGVQSNISSTTNDCNHPYYNINPDKRQYVQCIYSNSGDINKSEFENLLEWFFDRFRTCDISHQLQFIHQSALTHIEGKIWIACMTKETFDWVSSSLPHYSRHPYKLESLNVTNHLCEVVIPMVVIKENNLLNIFELLEKQNPNLCTSQWCVLKRRILVPDEQDYNTIAVSAFCTNELLSICVDSKSKVFLDGVNHKLKYCFWQIVFKFENN